MKVATIEDAVKELGRYGFDEASQQRFAARSAAAPANAVTGTLEPLPARELARLPALGTEERRRLRQRGCDLIRAGKVGVVVLAGGMATRFGGVVKAIVTAHKIQRQRSFLECKVDDVVSVADNEKARIPIYVMSSFATHDVIEHHLVERKLDHLEAVPIEVFPQFCALRLTPSGELHREADGTLSPYATGHGDLTFALRRSGVLARFRAAGGTTLLMSNVDNLGATLDPAIVGLHDELGGAITAEVVRKIVGDKGGAPALLDGVPQIIEGFRFPKDFDQDTIEVFNTNTFILDAAAIDEDFELPYYRVEKLVDGAKVIQFERLVGELTSMLPSRFVEVSREGEDSRFLPVKDPEELERQRADIDVVLRSNRARRAAG